MWLVEAIEASLAWLIHVVLDWVISLLVLVTRQWEVWRAGPREASFDAAAIAACGGMPHLAAVLPNGEVDIEDAAFLSRLMLASGAEWVTLYQEKGRLSERADELKRLLVRQGSAVDRLHTISDAEGSEGFVAGAVQGAVRDVCSGRLSEADIDANAISAHLPLRCPDASLVLCFDGPRRNGFLPWNIRVTTFVDAGDLHLLRSRNFVEILREFAKVQQRFGA
jgi:hypothetical protein